MNKGDLELLLGKSNVALNEAIEMLTHKAALARKRCYRSANEALDIDLKYIGEIRSSVDHLGADQTDKLFTRLVNNYDLDCSFGVGLVKVTRKRGSFLKPGGYQGCTAY